ncbi:small multi-drug export protein [Alicyclobacillus fodiniaquatilis]|uniref:Small multi-drug export protein n=1 Tax=Alicyclobacillus fodiniaquatilis TaxID=1661150 RepID=A0ABW4JRD3_9BACL
MSFRLRLTYGILFGVLFFLGSLIIGMTEHKILSTMSLIGTSITFEAQPAAVASLPLRFHPFSGAMISILANLIPIPLLMLILNEIILHWGWLGRRLQKAEIWSRKYGKYGVWVLVPLSPILGAYVSIGIGYVMRWNRSLALCSVLLGMVASSFIITYGGESIVRIFHALL